MPVIYSIYGVMQLVILKLHYVWLFCMYIAGFFGTRLHDLCECIVASPDVGAAQDPFAPFSEALLNLHPQYCLDDHTSEWCKYHSKIQVPYYI